MLKNVKYIPVTEDSHPYARAALKCDFDAIGYLEDEYFVYGTANLYDADEAERPIVIAKDTPYCNRMLIRRPADPEKFSGNIVIELLNPTAKVDIDRIWVNTWRYFVRHGDIFIGMVSKPDVFPHLHSFDPERYADINWPNPLPERELPEGLAFSPDPRWENGLLWDIMTDMGKLLRRTDPLNPLYEYVKKPTYLYMTGWSQCTGFVNRYVRSFAKGELAGIFDGYLSAGGGGKLTPINSYQSYKRGGIFSMEGRSVFGCDVPFIALNTESENKMAAWGADSDTPGDLFRSYQIPGSSHDERMNLDDWYLGDPDSNFEPYKGLEGEPNNYPYQYIFHTTFANLYRWVREKIPAARMPYIETERVYDPAANDHHFENLMDGFGNARGGIRTAALDLPTARYFNWCHEPLPDGGIKENWLYGHQEPFSAAFLTELYGSLENYRTLVTKATQRHVALGYILPEDKEDLINEVVAAAKERGLN